MEDSRTFSDKRQKWLFKDDGAYCGELVIRYWEIRGIKLLNLYSDNPSIILFTRNYKIKYQINYDEETLYLLDKDLNYLIESAWED